MLHADLADTPLASHRPDYADACDSLVDRFMEGLATMIPRDYHPSARIILEGMIEKAVEEGELGTDRGQLIVDALHTIYGDTSHVRNIRIIAAAALKRMGKDGRSYQEIGDELCVTRACVQAHSRRLEDQTGLKCRSDKRQSARAGSARRAAARRGQRRKLGARADVFTAFR